MIAAGKIAAGNFAVEKAELETVLASGIQDRTPSLAQLLRYVCEKCFQGTASEIKEYNIAVEALGRPPDFDQKHDAIVRVQFHRLRERLNAYYESEGAGHAVRIEIPPGQYIPRFLTAEPPKPKSAAPAPVPAYAALWPWTPLVAAAVILLGGLALWLARHDAKALPRAAAPVAALGSDSLRILAGLENGVYTDGFGQVWQSDRYFQGGSVVKLPGHAILGTREPRLYQTRREGSFRYDIPLKPGVYELRLHFAETFFGEDNSAGYGGENSRAFRVEINGAAAIGWLDVVGEVGASAADIKVFRDISPAADGQLHLTFTPIQSLPFMNAIEITPGTSGKLRPIRIVAQPRAYTDKEARVWMPDRYAVGGQMVKRVGAVTGTADPELYAGERFGNLAYTIPVPPGHYAVTLYLSEQWIGPSLPGGGGAGSRVFDIFCNGVALARDFDIFQRAGGSNRALVQTFHGLRPNHQGKLVLTLVPVRNFPLVNAIEVTDES
jgi:hypothetical protein